MGAQAAPAQAALIKVLDRSHDGATRFFAAKALGKSGSSAAPALVNTLKSKKFWVGGPAADALVQIGVPAVPTLRKALHEEGAAKREIVEVLSRIGGPDAAEALGEALQDGGEARSDAGRALIKMGKAGKKAVPALRAALKDKDSGVQESAAYALLAVDPTEMVAVLALIENLKSTSVYLSRSAAQALGPRIVFDSLLSGTLPCFSSLREMRPVGRKPSKWAWPRP